MSLTRLDRPWRRPGAVRYAVRRLPGLLRPPVEVHEPAAGSVSMLRDLPVVVRDGTTLRANVVLPAGGGRFPVLMSAHPYGKDNLPARRGRGWRVSIQYRMLRQTERVRFSSLTGWEAPDPAWWAAQGYAVASCDLRGAGTSQGKASLLSDQEGEDVHDLIEWAAAQPWSTGAIGLIGVSCLAISQWKAAALNPPGLKAICPWEGFTDAYPVPACTHRQPLVPGQVVQADMALGPSATFFRAGETLRLVVAGRWLWRRSLLTGQFPAAYQKGPQGRCTVHWGPEHQARLLLPIVRGAGGGN